MSFFSAQLPDYLKEQHGFLDALERIYEAECPDQSGMAEDVSPLDIQDLIDR